MQTAVARKQQEKRSGHPARAPAVEHHSDPNREQTSRAIGTPIFLQRSSEVARPPVQQQKDDEAPQPEQIEEEAPAEAILPKLIVGSPDDEYEREADRVAERVQRMPDSGMDASLKEEDEELLADQSETIQTKPLTPRYLQRVCSECKEELGQQGGASPTIQTKAEAGSSAVSSADVSESLSSPSGGSPIPRSIKAKAEHVLGHDLSHVRVHSDDNAHRAARDLGAKAFTHQNHIWLGSNESSDNGELIAHEATHVVQQHGAGNTPAVQRRPPDYQHPEDGGGMLERMREAMAEELHDEASVIPERREGAEPEGAVGPMSAPAPEQANRAAADIDRSELAARRAELEPGARPDADRPAEERPLVEAPQIQTKAEAKTSIGNAERPIVSRMASAGATGGAPGSGPTSRSGGSGGGRTSTGRAAAGQGEARTATGPGGLGGSAIGGARSSAGAGAETGAAIGGGGTASGGLLMPEPPEGLTAEDNVRLADTENQADAAEAATATMPGAGETVAEARSAVEEPEAETAARAASELTEQLASRAAPSPEIEDLCVRIRETIRRRRPPDEETLLEFDPREAAESSGRELNASVEGEAERVEGEYAAIEEEPEGTPQQEAQSLETPAAQVDTPSINAEQAVPGEAPAETMDLSADTEAQDQRIEDAGMNTAAAQEIEDPSNPVVQAREASGELSEVAERAPEEVIAEQTAIRDQAHGEMQNLQQQALQALRASRSATARDVGGGMVDLGSTEEEMRTNAGDEARRIFNDAQTRVTNLLEPLPRTALRRWETGIQVLSTRVEQQSEEFNRWKRERYEGIGGTALEIVEYFAGLPDWAINWLNRIETSFGDDVCELIREISSEVNSVIATCEEIIDNANRDIAAVFARLPVSLQSWAAGERANFANQLTGLRSHSLFHRTHVPSSSNESIMIGACS
jgi:hypothetical protein